MKVLLNTGSTIDEGRLAKGGNKYSEEYRLECAVCWLSPSNFESLGCPEKVKVTSKDEKHSIIVYTKCTDAMMDGDVFMPRAIWSNVIIDPYTFSTGSPLYKGSPVTVEAAEGEVLSTEDVVLNLYMGGK
jgi:formylmethanofuran dehydrogenase subunit D